MPQSDPNKALPLVAFGPSARFVGEAYKKLGKEMVAAGSPAIKQAASKLGKLTSKVTKTKPAGVGGEVSEEAMTKLGNASVVGAGALAGIAPSIKDEQVERVKKKIEELDQKMKPKMIGKPALRKPATGLGRPSMVANPKLRQGE